MKRFHNIGFIQGRLSPIINNKIQVFPVENWEKEFSEAKIIGLDIIEWTIDELPSFKIFRVKVIMTSTNQALAPVVQDLRCIALA